MTEMKKHSQFYNKFHPHFETDDIFWENEVNSNLFCTLIMCGAGFFLLLAWVLNLVGAFQSGKAMNTAAIAGFIELAIPSVLCFVLKGEKTWLKYFILIMFTMCLSTIDAVLTFNVVLIMCIPLILSIRYCDVKLTIFIAIYTVVSFLVCQLIGNLTGSGRLDMNFYDPKTPFSIEVTTTVREALLNAGLVDNKARTVTYMTLAFIPKMFVYIIIAFACVFIARRGRDMVVDQDHVSSNSSRIKSELAVATGIQAGLLPSTFPAFPDHSEFDIYASMHPAKEVGGDFYDFFMIDDEHLALVIGDVSGKGVPAALFMVTAKTLIKDHTVLGLSPAEVFTRVNKSLCDNNEAGLFVTGWIGILNVKTGVLTYCNAGHNAPLLLNDDNGFVYFKLKPGFVLAGMDSVRYKEYDVQLNRGAKLFIYTDGVTEATRKDNVLYGESRLRTYLNIHIHDNIKDTIEGLREDINTFVRGAEQFDDITMLMVELKRFENDALSQTFDANIDTLPSALEFIESTLEPYGTSMKVQTQINIAFEEMYVNVCHYAYPGRDGSIKVEISVNDDVATISIKDKGLPFNPLDNVDPDVKLSAEERNIGGLGIFMVKQTMDSVKYEFLDGMNIFTFTKGLK